MRTSFATAFAALTVSFLSVTTSANSENVVNEVPIASKDAVLATEFAQNSFRTLWDLPRSYSNGRTLVEMFSNENALVDYLQVTTSNPHSLLDFIDGLAVTYSFPNPSPFVTLRRSENSYQIDVPLGAVQEVRFEGRKLQEDCVSALVTIEAPNGLFDMTDAKIAKIIHMNNWSNRKADCRSNYEID